MKVQKLREDMKLNEVEKTLNEVLDDVVTENTENNYEVAVTCIYAIMKSVCPLFREKQAIPIVNRYWDKRFS